MRPAALRLFLAAGALAAGGLLVWLAGAAPVLQGAQAGSALDTGPQGLSGLARDLRERGVLAASVRIDASAEGVGITPTSWDTWGLRPQDGVLVSRSDVALRPAELAAARAWLESGGRLVVVAEAGADLAIPTQILGARPSAQPMQDGAYDGSSRRPVVPDGPYQYQLDGALAVAGPEPLIASAGLAWTSGERPTGPDALRPHRVAVRFPVGLGSIVVLGDSHPISNGGRGERDNERLAQRIADELASGGGAVFIDEGHRSGGAPVRLDLALRAIGPSGRLALGAAVLLAAATVLFPWPRRLAAILRRRRRHRGEAPSDPLGEVRALHPDWDARLLARLASGAKR